MNTETATFSSKLEQAKQYLGKRYVLHPEYKRADNPAHSHQASAHLQQVRARAVAEGRV